MEDQDIEESTDADKTSVKTSSEHGLHSEDSRNSEDSYLYNNDDPMDENDYDDWGDDVYYNESTEDDSKYDTCPIIDLDETQERSIEIVEVVPPVVEIIEETLEENNNDPNNNMDSIELNGREEAAEALHVSAAERPKETETRDVSYVDRAQSPKPGCSKDSQPVFAPSMPCTSTNEATRLQKSRHILRLVSKIHLDSVLDALCKDDKVPIKELKFWDLIPERERREYSEVSARQDNSKVISAVACEKASEPVDNTRMQMEWTVTNNGAKRGPTDDICTVQPKKSSSDSDLSINAPVLPSNSLPRVSSTSEIAHLQAKSVNRGAIPKVRDVPLEKAPETPMQAWNALLTAAQHAAPLEEFPTLRTVNEALVEKSAAALEVKSAPSSSMLRAPILEYRATKSAEELLENSKPSAVGAACSVMPKSVSASGPIYQQKLEKMGNQSAKPAPQRLPVTATMAPKSITAAVPVMFRDVERAMIIAESKLMKAVNQRKHPVPVTAATTHQQGQMVTANRPKQLAATTTAPVAAAQINQPMEIANRPKQVAPITARLAAAPINQQRQSETVNRLQQPTPVTAATNHQQRLLGTLNRLPQPAPVTAATSHQQRLLGTLNRLPQPAPVTAATSHQQRQTGTVNRLSQPAPVTATTTHQQKRMETLNRPQQSATTTAPVAAAPINQQRPMDMGLPQGPSKFISATITGRPLYVRRQAQFQEREQALQLPEAPIQRPAPANEQSTKRVICKEMYYKLRSIFPNVDRKYIKKLCPPDWGPGNKDDQMAPIIEHLLEAGETLPQQPIEEIIELAENDVSYKSADDLYEFLIGIFPDADPHFLRDFAEKNLGRDEAIKNFVNTNLERREYPTREQYMARLKITEQQRRYTTGFEVKQFLSIIPDPSKHFMDAQRQCKHQTVAFEFLKSHFKKLRVATISRAYSQNRYNLSLAAQALESLPDELKSKRGGYEMPTEDILLLQEIAFVKHKADINKYIAQVKKTEDEEFKTLKAMNQLLECQCCYDSECVPSKCSECDNGHIFCNGCVVRGTNAKMGEDQTRIHCFINCGSEFSLSVLQRVLAPTTFSILLKKRQAAEVIEAGLDGLVSCPFCHFASIPPEGDKIFKCLNPECTKESCRLCKELSHVPLKCDEVTKTENARRYIEERMTQALARKCYKCQRAYFKEEGCNKITCPCGAIMCYLCDKPIKDYSHFRGQGSDDRSLCPLYSDTIRLDAVAVHKVAEEAKREMLKRNPNINIDTTGLLPHIPRPRNGPHNDVLNADELPRRAQRVLDLPPL